MVNIHKITIHLESLPNWAASTKNHLRAFEDIQKRGLSCEIAGRRRLLSTSHIVFNNISHKMIYLFLVIFNQIFGKNLPWHP